MHKLLAIFLAIGIAHSAVVPSQDVPPSKSTTLQVQGAGGQIASLFGASSAETTSVKIASIAAEIQQLSNNRVSTLGPVLVKVAKLCNTSLSQNDIKSQVYNESVDLQLIINFLNQFNGSLNFESFCIVLLNIFDGLKDVLTTSQTVESNEGISWSFGGVLNGNVSVEVVSVVALLQTLSIKGVNRFGSLFVEIAELYGLQISSSQMPPQLSNSTVNISLVVKTLKSINGNVDLQSILNVLVSSSKNQNVTVTAQNSILSVLLTLYKSSNQVSVVDITAVLKKLLVNGEECTMSAVLVEIYKLFGVNVAVEDFPSVVVNLPVNLSSLITAFAGQTGSISLNQCLSILGVTVNGLLNLVASVPGLLVNLLSGLVETSNQVSVVDITAVLTKLLVNGEECTMSAVLVEIYKLFGVNYPVKDLPSAVVNLPVNLSSLITAFAGQTGSISLNQCLSILGVTVSGLLNFVQEAPGTSLNILGALLSSKKQVDITIIKAALRLLAINKIDTLGPVVIAFGKLYGVALSVKDIPLSIYKLKVNISSIIAALEGKTGLVGIDVIINILGCVVGGLLNLVALIPNTGLSIITSLLSGATGAIDVSTLKIALGKLSLNANFGQILTTVANVCGVSLAGRIPLVISNIRGVLPLLLNVLNAFSGSISVPVLIGLISWVIPGLLLVTSVQVLKGAVLSIGVGVGGVLSVVGGLTGGLVGNVVDGVGDLLDGLLD